ncbi:MAG: hypothetical protein ACR2KZ_04255 [Segetibacter sp.]
MKQPVSINVVLPVSVVLTLLAVCISSSLTTFTDRHPLQLDWY